MSHNRQLMDGHLVSTNSGHLLGAGVLWKWPL